MVQCAACGEDNPARARFCLSCGTPFAAAELAVKARAVRKIVTVVFCDLTGSTELGERLDPESLRDLLDRYFATMSDVLTRHGGTVEKFIGDAVVAVFGVPVLHEDDALRAVRAAIEMTSAMSQLAVELDRRWGVRPSVRIGVNTGEVLAGDIAGRERLATGDAVNVAARLEQAALAGQVVLGQDTYRLVRDAVRADALPPMRLKGKADPAAGYLLHEVLAGAQGYSRRLDAPLVGRKEELTILRRSYDDAVHAGACRRALVVGMAGIGKSRLTAEFLSGLGGRATVLSGPCLPYGHGITFWPLREMLRGAAGWTHDETAQNAVRRLADLLPGEPDGELVAERAAALVGLSDTPGRMEEGFWAVRRLLESLSRWRPVVVVVDDLHWAEPALLDLLDDQLRARGPIFILSGARPEFFDDHPGWGADFVRVVLDPLRAEHCDQLIDAVLGSNEVQPAVREHVRAAAEGNPLFVEQMLANFREDGVLTQSATGWVATRELTPDMIPPSIQTLLQARLERLPGDEQAEIEMAAVVGRVFWRSAVAELAQEAVGSTAGSHLLALVFRELISPDTSDFIGDDAYHFRHILVRDAAYNALPKVARAEAHQRFSRWLERVAGDRADEYDEILGYHLERAFELRSSLAVVGDRERSLARAAGRRLSAAGRRSFARGDIAAAVNLLGRAHRLLVVDPPARLRLVPTLAEALHWRGDLRAAAMLLEASTTEADALHDQRLAMHVGLARAVRLDLTTGEEQAGHDAVAVFTDAGDDEGLARAWMLIGHACFADGRTADAELAWMQALPPARRAAPELAEETAMWLAMYSLYGPTPISEVAARLDKIEVEVAGKPYREGSLLRGRAFVAATRSEFATAYRLLRRSRETFDDLGLHHVSAVVSHVHYEVALREGILAASVAELSADERALASAGERWARSTTAAMLAHALCAAGRFTEALESASSARDLTNPGDAMSEVLWRTATAKVLAKDGRHDEAQLLAAEAVSMVAPTDWLCVKA
ncbi:MAG: AAA family ATPase, partial [Propionibacteriales bacterium]|nr:AAA family ATPase [Propionibacteriales bacterium]